ncbi:S8 family peptidase [Paenibacillus dendritiformis]|uniref:S8 family peptidase n=1 Tax=Paenibacillus dendritiformis TaxID=130049 RepID=UPI00248C3557|nr:S8 family peptidase [Paenibacillus dendritiformis]WGU95411.1 S8 family peptidase [Paenibacillus dendritiformis]
MRNLTRMLQAVVHEKPARHTVRKIIVLKDRKSFNACVRELKKQGIVPVKQVKSACMLCCHVHPHAKLAELMKHPSVRRVENDARVRAHAVGRGRRSSSTRVRSIKRNHSTAKGQTASMQQIPWGVKRIQAPKVWPSTRGKGIRIAIVDTGISPHPDLRISGGINTIRPGASYDDDNGHGTHVAGTAAALGRGHLLYGTAPEAELYAVKALDEKGEGYVSDIVEGVEWCIRNRMDVINLSLGLNGPSKLLRNTIRRAHRQGIVIVASAGNNGKDAEAIDEPAIYPEVIAVAATDRLNCIASFSSRGGGIDVAAPGADICSTSYRGGFAEDSGTSMAAPHVSGTVGLMLAACPGMLPEQIRSALVHTSQRLRGELVTAQGAGLINAQKAVAYTAKAKHHADESVNPSMPAALTAGRPARKKPTPSRQPAPSAAAAAVSGACRKAARAASGKQRSANLSRNSIQHRLNKPRRR